MRDVCVKSRKYRELLKRKEFIMKKGFLKGFAALICVLTLIFAQVVSVAAAGEDVVLDDAGSPLIRVIDPGDGDGYTYMGYVYCGEGIGPEYKYLQLSYKGDETAFSELRIEVLDGSDSKIGVFWFSENAEGSFRTEDGNLLPAPTDEVQTVVVDLAASGIDVSNGIHAMHIHDTQGIGAVIFTDARLMTSPISNPAADSAEDTADEEPTVTEEPVVTEEPAVTEKPAETEPATAEKPVQTDNTAEEKAAPVSVTEPVSASENNTLPWIIVGCGVVFVGACVAVKVIVDKKKK